MAVCGANFQKGLWHPSESYYFWLFSRIFDYTLVPASFQVYDKRPLAGT
jgi:hypothetical protein